MKYIFYFLILAGVAKATLNAYTGNRRVVACKNSGHTTPKPCYVHSDESDSCECCDSPTTKCPSTTERPCHRRYHDCETTTKKPCHVTEDPCHERECDCELPTEKPYYKKSHVTKDPCSKKHHDCEPCTKEPSCEDDHEEDSCEDYCD